MVNINRVHLKLGNKVLSIIQGEGTYSDEGTCEVAYITERGEVSNNPQGYVTASELVKIIETGSLLWGRVNQNPMRVDPLGKSRHDLSEAWSGIKRML